MDEGFSGSEFDSGAADFSGGEFDSGDMDFTADDYADDFLETDDGFEDLSGDDGLEDLSGDDFADDLFEQDDGMDLQTDDVPDEVTADDFADDFFEQDDGMDLPADDVPDEVTADDFADDFFEQDDGMDLPADDTSGEVTADDFADDFSEQDDGMDLPADDTPDEVTADDLAVDFFEQDDPADVPAGDGSEPTAEELSGLSDDPNGDVSSEQTEAGDGSQEELGEGEEPSPDAGETPDLAGDMSQRIDEISNSDMTNQEKIDALQQMKEELLNADARPSDTPEMPEPPELLDTPEMLDPSESTDKPKTLKLDDTRLLEIGNDSINQQLEMLRDDYADKGFTPEEIEDKIAADRWRLQQEYLDETFPGQGLSPNAFNGFNENGAKDRIHEIENSPSLQEILEDPSPDQKVEADLCASGEFDEPVSPANDAGEPIRLEHSKEIFEQPRYSDLSQEFLNELPESRRNAVDLAYKNAPQELVDALNEHISDLKPVEDTGMSVNEFGEQVKDGCYYSPDDHQVRMDEKLDDDEYAEIIPHEMTHFLDHERGWESRRPEFVSAMESDMKSMDVNTPEGKQRYFEMMDDAFNTGAAYDRNVSDIMNGVFWNDRTMAERFEKEGVARYTHPDEYWQRDFAREAETYANLGAVNCSKNIISNHFLERYYPATYQQFRKNYNIK